MTVSLCERMDIGKSAVGGWNYIQRLLAAEGSAENSSRFWLAEEQFRWFQPAVTQRRSWRLQRIGWRRYRRRCCLAATFWAGSLENGCWRTAAEAVVLICHYLLLHTQTIWKFVQHQVMPLKKILTWFRGAKTKQIFDLAIASDRKNATFTITTIITSMIECWSKI